jgi:hypothetical protein
MVFTHFLFKHLCNPQPSYLFASIQQFSISKLASFFFVSRTSFAKTVKAKVHVNFEKPIGKIEPEIYGQFIEYLGRAITGGVVDAKTNQVRKDVLKKSKDFKRLC